MIILKDKVGDIHLKANYQLNYDYAINGFKILGMVEVPKVMRCLRMTNIKDIISFYNTKANELTNKIETYEKLIKFLQELQTKYVEQDNG